MKPMHLLLAAITVAGIAGAVAPSHGDPPRFAEEPRPLPASAVESLGDPHAGMDMDPESDDEMAGEDDPGNSLTGEDMPEGEMPDDDIHRGMR